MFHITYFLDINASDSKQYAQEVSEILGLTKLKLI